MRVARHLRRGVRLLATSLGLALAANGAEGGGEPVPLPVEWVKVLTDPGGDIVQFIQRLPHDPANLGVVAAAQRRKPYAVPLHTVNFTSLDGTPLD